MGRAFNDAWTLLKELPDIREMEKVLSLYNQAKASGAFPTPEQIREKQAVLDARRDMYQTLTPEEQEFMRNKILDDYYNSQPPFNE